MVLLAASINHLDEAACSRLHEDDDAREVYRTIFDKLAGLTNPAGVLLALDGGRKNIFPSLGLRNPIARSIEWEKHQQPEVWVDLLAGSGFELPSIRWLSFNTLRAPGRMLLGNRLAAFFLTSEFLLTMRRRSVPVT